MQSVIEKMQSRVKQISDNKDARVKPGQPERFTAAATIGDAIRQGDLYIVIAETVPDDYVKVDFLTDESKQLVPGNTQGAKHCLDSLDGVELWRPAQWTEESLDGPFVRLAAERTIEHPTHGAVTVPAGLAFTCHYQREWDREAAKERRAKD